MSVFHVIGYWYLAVTLIGIAAWLTYELVEFLGKSLWKKMTRLRDIYVLNWWIAALNREGFIVPTKSNMDELRRRMNNLDYMSKEHGNDQGNVPEPVARANIYMHKGRRQFLLTELGTKAAGDLGVGVHDLFAAPVAQEPVGVVSRAGPMYSHGTTVAVFEAEKVPVGTKLYAAPVVAQAQLQQSENQEALADTQRAIIEAAERRGYERAIAECGQDRKDAGRYRLLRRGQHWGIINAAGDTLRNDVLDAAIDSVIAAKGPALDAVERPIETTRRA